MNKMCDATLFSALLDILGCDGVVEWKREPLVISTDPGHTNSTRLINQLIYSSSMATVEIDKNTSSSLSLNNNPPTSVQSPLITAIDTAPCFHVHSVHIL